MTNKLKAGIIGGAGYTGGETLRLLLLHPHVEVAFVQSRSQAGKPVPTTHADLIGETDLVYTLTGISILKLISLIFGF